MYVGVDYYPEHWPVERWDRDAQLMRDAGFNVVRLAEFAWQKLEPEEGRFEFGWLDDALHILGSHGISAVIGTPTGAMPAWVNRKYPDTAAVKPNGDRHRWGVRKNNCPTSGTFRLLSERITRAMALHYAGHSNVIGWQTDNEFDGPMCYCGLCRVDFQEWLRAKYGCLDALNTAWGTHFWAHTYGEYAEIELPENTEHYNPSLCLDWFRYHSWRTVRFQREQVDILRALCPSHFVTHNMMGFNNNDIDPYDLTKDLEFASLDNYPIWSGFGIPYEASAQADLTRGLKRKNYWIMETTAGPCGWGAFGRNPYPGELRKVAYQQLAHGADGHVWFRWRTCTAGREQYWHGLLGHDGKPLRRYQEAAQTAKEYHKLWDELAGTTVEAKVAMIFDYDSRWAVRIQPGFDTNDYRQAMMRYYRALFRAGINVDMVSSKPDVCDLSQYRAVIAPDLHVLPDELAARLADYVADGGVLLADCRTGVKTETNLCHDRTLPGLLSETLGIAIEEYGSHQLEYVVSGTDDLPGAFTSTHYNDWISLRGATALAGYEHWHLCQFPAATRNVSGKGIAYYVGTVVKEDSFYDGIIANVLRDAHVAAEIVPPTGVEVSTRSAGGKSITIVINHNDEPVTVPLTSRYTDLLDGAGVEGKVELDRFGIAVLKKA
jgi:beta-galactosidase